MVADGGSWIITAWRCNVVGSMCSDTRWNMLVYSNLYTLISAAYIANIIFGCKLVNERTFLESGHTVFEIRGNNMLHLRVNLNLTKLKQWLTDLLICSISCMEVLSIHGNFRYTGHLSGPNFGLVENCRHFIFNGVGAYIIKVSIFQQILLNKFSSSVSFGLEQIIKALVD